MTINPKHYFLREEIPIAEELLGLADDLRKEFLEIDVNHDEYIS